MMVMKIPVQLFNIQPCLLIEDMNGGSRCYIRNSSQTKASKLMLA